MKTIGEVIKQYRRNRNVTQKVLSKELGISSKYLSDLETNRRMPSLALIDKISIILEIDKEELKASKMASSLKNNTKSNICFPDEKLKRIIREIDKKQDVLNEIEQNIKLKIFEYEKLERTSGVRSKITWLCIEGQKKLAETIAEIISVYSLADEERRKQTRPAIKQLTFHLDLMSKNLKKILEELNTLEVTDE